jgi:hypothetical protein
MTAKQSAAVRPEPTLYRKAAIARGGVRDHAGEVRIEPIPDFDLDRTIFKTLEGRAARLVVKARVGQEVIWDAAAGEQVDRAYRRAADTNPLPDIDPAIIDFMVKECDFDVEHADGSFLDHLYFCFEYSAHHFPGRSPLVMLLHSILGTGTNTFAMTADKIPALRELLTDFEWTHVEAFPSVLRLLYDAPLRRELRANRSRFSTLESIEFRRVIDNQPVTMSGDELWTQLNYQLIHLVDFLPVANWTTHTNDTSFILFRDLYELLESGGELGAKIDYAPASGRRSFAGEPRTVANLLGALIPVGVSERMAGRSVRTFSRHIGHSLALRLNWA